MNKFLNFLKPDPFLPQIPDTEEVKTKYHYWRLRIFYSMFIGYALYYITRKSFTFAMPGLVQDLGFEKGELGLLGSIFAITYGISKFVSGMLGDQVNPRFFMGIGLLMTGLVNISFGLSSSILFFALFWGLNGWFQGFGWPACARYLTQWYSHSERGSWWSTWNISHNVGAFVSPLLAGFLIYYFDWRFAMYIPGIICIIGSVFLFNRLRDTPQSLGLPSIESFRNDYTTTNKDEKDTATRMSSMQILREFILNNRYLWILAIAYFCIYVVRQGINDWTVLYLTEEKGYSSISSAGSVSLFEIGGIFGALTAGWSSDYLFGAKRGPVNLIFSVGLLAAVLVFWSFDSPFPFFDSVLIFLIGFMVFGPQMMIGMHAAEICPKNAAATATGFVGTFAYIGAAVAGYPVGMVTQLWGWNGFFWFMAVCSLTSILLLIPLWSVTAKSLATKRKSGYA